MCTIAGYWSEKPIDPAPLLGILETLKHRGPDSHGLWVDGDIHQKDELANLRAPKSEGLVGLAHSRLRIVGEAGACQPFLSCDGRISLVHNGEIYNYPELRDMLGDRHNLDHDSDSEVLVHLLEEAYQGDLMEALRQVQPLLDGMYGLAATDGKCLVLARDPAGKKPVYYQRLAGAWYFASEKKALNDSERILALPPGHRLQADDMGIRTEPGVTLPVPQLDIEDFREAVDLYKTTLVQAVRKRLTGIRENRLGVIFSGGVDSVLVAELLKQEQREVICYCSGTRGSADLAAAASAADSMGLDLKYQEFSQDDLTELLPTIMHDVEEQGLLQVEVSVPMYLAAQAASRDGIRVVFTGQAADEIFAGYDWYRGVVGEHGYFRLHQRLWEDIRALSVDTLEREDKLTMAHSVELRVPYLDREVVHLAMRCSPRLKIHGPDDMMRKHIHRQAAVELGVPRDLAFRRKDPAQSGSGIHSMVEALAARDEVEPCENSAQANLEADKGSLYRYDTGDYGTEQVRTWMEEMAAQVREAHESPLSRLS